MKLLITLSLISVISLKVSAQEFTFSGHLAGVPDSKVYFYHLDAAGKSTRDSAILDNGNFVFKGTIAGDVTGFISVNRASATYKKFEEGNSKSFFLSPGNITALGSFDNLPGLVISGSKSNDEFEKINSVIAQIAIQNKPLTGRYNVLNTEFAHIKKANEDDPKLKVLDKTLDSLRDVISEPYTAAIKKFIAENKSSYVSIYELDMRKSSWPIADVKRLYNSLDANKLQGQYNNSIREYFNKIENKTAKNFTTLDINGKNISLADFKGKYVILDFWASWCVPCRASTPHLKQVYSKYHPKGLDVIAVSDDDSNPNAWHHAVEKDKSDQWTNVLRGYKGYGKESPNDISELYTVSLLPTKILIDKNGNILGRYIGTEDTEALDKKLTEIFGK